MHNCKKYYVYILTNKNNAVLYTGITSDLKRRIYEHKEKLIGGYTSKYNVSKLVYFEVFEDPENAIFREKQIKAGSRENKIGLVDKLKLSATSCGESPIVKEKVYFVFAR